MASTKEISRLATWVQPPVQENTPGQLTALAVIYDLIDPAKQQEFLEMVMDPQSIEDSEYVLNIAIKIQAKLRVQMAMAILAASEEQNETNEQNNS